MNTQDPTTPGAGIASDEPDLVQRLRLMLAVMHMDPRNRAVITKAADELERLIADVGPLLASLAEADAEIERLRAALAAQVAAPAGWKLVPLEPTDAMVDATYHGQPVDDIYRDMLAAAPQPAPSAQPPAVPAQVVEAPKWQALYRRAINEANGLTNYVEDRPELRRAERNLEAIEAEARALTAQPPATTTEGTPK